MSEPLGTIFAKNTEKNAHGLVSNVICNSARLGLIPQREYFDKDIANSENTSGYYIIKQNDFVYNPRKSTEAPYGPVSVYKYKADGIVSPLYLCFRAKMQINIAFFEWLFKSPAWHRYIYLSGDSGARHDRVSMKDSIFFNMPLCVPGVQEQAKIANFLSMLDSRIEKQHRLVELLKSYKRGVVMRMENKKFANINRNSSWERMSIGEAFTVTRGYVLPVSETRQIADKKYRYPVYSSQTKDDGLMGYYTKYLYQNAITWTTDGANAGFVRYRQGDFYCTNVCGVLISNKKKADAYVAEVLNGITKRHVSYVGNPKLMNNVMSEISIEFPSVEVSAYFSEIISKIEDKINSSTKICRNLERVKQSLMSQLFI